ncbi:MAG: metal-dependent hydrolase [Nitrososphaerota archaeon]
MVKVQWLGHASFRIDFAGKTVLIDPFITGNPLSPVKSIDELEKVDVIVVTHDHPDHFGDSVEIAKKFNSKIVAVFETANKAREAGAPECIGMNIGGTAGIDNLLMTLTPAFHSMSSNPSGVIVSDGETNIYHTGDTSLFSDMKLIGKSL